jgi:small subunit ribosomal protein S7
MPRRREVPKRVILPDPQFHSVILSQFINVIMKSGKKSIAENIMYGALKILDDRVKKNKKSDDDSSGSSTGSSSSTASVPMVIGCFEQALDNVRPSVEVRSRRVGGATYQIPVEVRAARSRALGMRWIVSAARKRGEKGMVERLAGELYDAFENKGTAVKKREDTHKMAKANQAFAHFRWN